MIMIDISRGRYFATPFLAILFLIAAGSPVAASGVDLSIGRKLDLDSTSPWEKWTAQLDPPSPNARLVSGGSYLSFTVPDANTEMLWRRSLRPAWLEFHHYMNLTYRASGVPSSPSSLLALRTGGSSIFNVLSMGDVQNDGEIHELTIDIKTLTASPQLIGIDLFLEAGSAGNAEFIIERLDFTDHSPGFVFPTPTPFPPVNTGFDLDLSDTASWEAKPEWTGSAAAGEYDLEFTGHSMLLTVGDPYKTMKWHNPSIGTQDTASYPYLLLNYRCRNLRYSKTDYAVWLRGVDEARPLYQGDLVDDENWRWAFSPIGIDNADQMALQIRNAGDGEAFFEIGSLQFVDGDPRSDLSWFTPLHAGWNDLTSGTADFSFVDLTPHFNIRASQILPRMGYNVPWFREEKISVEKRVPFLVRAAEPNLVATSIPDTDFIEIPVNRTASEVFFILGAMFPAREIPGSERIIDAIDETERFLVEICYSDGSRESFFPMEITTGEYQIVNNTFSAFTIPANPGKTIRRLRFHDKSDGGLFALAAVSLNVSSVLHYPDAFRIPEPYVVKDIPNPPKRTPGITLEGDLLSLENSVATLRFNVAGGLSLEQWISRFTGHDVTGGATDRRFFSVDIDGSSLSSLDFLVDRIEIATSGTAEIAMLDLSTRVGDPPCSATIVMGVDPSPEIFFSMNLHNKGTSPVTLELRFPDLPHLTLGPDPENLYYTFPALTFVHGTKPAIFSSLYSGKFPLQFLDLNDPKEGWGICLLVKDLELIHKYYSLEKKEDHASMAIRYPVASTDGLLPGEALEIAPFSLGVHKGDWHSAMNAYMDWVSTWYSARSPRQKWFREIYTCRRDYPIGGTGYLFDRKNDTYTFPVELENAEKYLGGADMIDISSWGWSAAHGRVGDYRLYELGGLENFRSGISYSQGRGVPVGLYIEGYLLDERATVYVQNGEKWKMINSSGEEIRSGTHEMRICPHVSDWQDYMKDLYHAVASETGASAMYIDVFGMATEGFRCYAADHGHSPGEPPLRGEYVMTRKIRESLNALRPGIPLYTEYNTVDVISQFQDGSFCYTIWSGDNAISPTETGLFRFCFPDYKRIELVNGLFLAMNWSSEGLKKAFLNGEGLWIKGDLASWYDADTVAFYKKSHELFRDHRDAMAGLDPSPFLTTLAGDVYAHSFSSGEKTILTFYNANRRSIAGDLLDIGPMEDRHVVDLWGEIMLDNVDTSPAFKVHATLPPREIGCIGIFPRRMNASLTGDIIMVSEIQMPPEGVLELTGILEGERKSITVSKPGKIWSSRLSDLFPRIPRKLILKIRGEEVVRDVIIIDVPNDRVSWEAY